MRRDFRWLAIMGLLGILEPGTAQAQLQMSGHLLHARLIQYEPVTVQLHIRNNTSQELMVSTEGGDVRLAFRVEDTPGQSVSLRKDAAKVEFKLPAHGTVEKSIDLLKIYDMRKTGPYSVTARLEWRGMSFPTAKLYADIVPGLEIASVVAEVPGDTSFRTYSLRTLNRDQMELLFLRIDDRKNSLCYGMFDLGRITRAKAPEMMVDRNGRVNVMHQSGPSRFTYTVMTANGQCVERKVFGSDGGSPQLVDDGTGGIVVDDSGTRNMGVVEEEDDPFSVRGIMPLR